MSIDIIRMKAEYGLTIHMRVCRGGRGGKQAGEHAKYIADNQIIYIRLLKAETPEFPYM